MVYTQVVLIAEVEDPDSVTCIQSYDQSIYLGTNSGEIVHYFRAGDEGYIFASRQKSKKRAVRGIWLLPELQRALVLTSSTTSVFSLPEFAPCNMKSMREVNDISCEGSEITVFSNSAVRIVTIQDDSLKLVRNIEYPGVLRGVRRSSYALVASDSYDLIDLDNVQKIPLFPVGDQGDEGGEFEPIIVPISSEEFLVTTGTKNDEPAMGLVVNISGDISRGTIAWPKYPSSVAVDFPNVAAVIDNKVMIYSLDDQSLIQTLEFEKQPVVKNVLQPYTTRSKQVEDKLRKVNLNGEAVSGPLECFQQSTMFLFSDKVECLLSTPRLIELEQVTDDDKLYDELELFDLSTEQAIQEMEYLKMMVGLRGLKNHDISSTVWFDGTLDPRTILYIYSPQDVQGEIWIYNGLREILDAVPKKPDNKFLIQFFTEWLKKRDLESIADKQQVFASLELAYLRLLIRTNASREVIYKVIDHEVIESSETGDAQQLLLESSRYFLLSRLYQRQGKQRQVLESWSKMISKEWKDDEFSHGEEKMMAYLLQCTDPELVWEYGMWLVARYPSAIKIFKRKQDMFEEHKVMEELKGLDSDDARREYLKFLVYDKKSELFTSDLISFLIDDLLEKLDVKAVQSTYDDYCSLDNLEKRNYVDYLTSVERKHPNDNLTKLRLEVLYLLRSSEDYDAEHVAKKLEPYPLKMELCVVRGKLKLHETVLETLCHDLHDYESAIQYCQSQPGDDQAPLFKALFLQFLKLENEKERLFCVRQLLDKWGHTLDTDLVLNKVPADWPVETLNEYLSHVFRRLMSDKNKSMVKKSLARSENIYMNKQLRGLTSKLQQQDDS